MLDHCNANLRKLVWKAKVDKGSIAQPAERGQLHTRSSGQSVFTEAQPPSAGATSFWTQRQRRVPAMRKRDCRTLKSWNMLYIYQGNKETLLKLLMSQMARGGVAVCPQKRVTILNTVGNLRCSQLMSGICRCHSWGDVLPGPLCRCFCIAVHSVIINEKGKGGALLVQGQKQRDGVRHIMFYCLLTGSGRLVNRD